MAKFFDLFPKIVYDIQGKQYSNYSIVTNVFFRLRVIRSVLKNISTYYEHTIKDGDTPETLAEKVYGEPEAHWVILLANDIVDPQYDWPLNYNTFKNYIKNKYGSIENAKTQIHHYEKVIQRTESLSGITTETRFTINEDMLSNTIPNNYYESWESLTAIDDNQTFNLGNGKTVYQVVSRDAISYYDYENELNEKKRLIKVIKPEYYPLILEEFNKLTSYSNTPFLRKLF